MPKKRKVIAQTDGSSRTEVIILGRPIRVHFTIHEPAYVEWSLIPKDEGNETEMKLLDMLLRTHYCQFIESACREAAFYQAYAASAASDDWADDLAFIKYAKELLTEDVPF